MTDKLVNFFFDEEKKRELDILAKREGRTLKEIFTEITDEYLKVHKEGNPQHLITSFQNNEDFMGFPSIAVTLENKRKYADSMPSKLKDELYWHIQEWHNILQRS